MKLEFKNDIDKILLEINSLNNNSDNNLNEISDDIKKKKVITGNTYALEQFNRKQNYLTYKRCIKKNSDSFNTKKDYNIIECNDMLESLIEENDYKKPWNKLDKYQKKKKIKKNNRICR